MAQMEIPLPKGYRFFHQKLPDSVHRLTFCIDPYDGTRGQK